MASNNQAYDYVIVGAGSAGCALAGRLAEDTNISVCLLEAGPPDKSILIHMPSAFDLLFRNPKYNWMYNSLPEPHADNRRIYQPRGKTLGGSSSINGLVFLRGNAIDFDNWGRPNGLESWNYAHVLPYFKRMETWSEGGNDYRGDSGPVKIRRPRRETFTNELSHVFLEAGAQAGYGFTDDPNGYMQEGFSHWDQTIHKGRRSSAAVSFIRQKRTNLTIIPNAMTHKIVVENGRAVGVRAKIAGEMQTIRAERDVLLSAGAANSPQLLMLSGIGNAEELKEHDIDVVNHLPGVGKDLQDHPEFYLIHKCLKPITLYSQMNHWGKFKIGAQWIWNQTGLGATNHFDAGNHIRTRAGLKAPDLQNLMMPIGMAYEGEGKLNCHGFAIDICLVKPTSRGHITIASANPDDTPLIQLNFLETENDRQFFRDALRLTREIIGQKAFDSYRGEAMNPDDSVQTDADIDTYARAHVASGYHICGTCRMGYDEEAVVDADLKVHGIEGLRVIDASIMPEIPGANTNAASIMIGDKGAAHVLDDLLAPSEVPSYVPENYATSQR